MHPETPPPSPPTSPSSSTSPSTSAPLPLYTRILPISASEIGTFNFSSPDSSFLKPWTFTPAPTSSGENLLAAVDALHTSTTPLAFPTETVYGLAANATSQQAVQGIFAAKNRPADNPLIVHVASLEMLRGLLRGGSTSSTTNGTTATARTAAGTDSTADFTNSISDTDDLDLESSNYAFNISSTDSSERDSPLNNPPASTSTPSPDLDTNTDPDPIPPIYLPLIRKFWPGPLSILLPLTTPSPLAASVTCSLPTFAARMPSSPLALALISLSNLPLAAPSANASGRPSPTTAAHVAHDLQGKIEIVLDGGACEVGVESTVVDGLCDPPVVLRPGGVGVGAIREVRGWENVEVGWRDGRGNEKSGKEDGGNRRKGEGGQGVGKGEGEGKGKEKTEEEKPRAPGMKYRHYSPRAEVMLAEAGIGWDVVADKAIKKAVERGERRFGVIRTKSWSRIRGQEIPAHIQQVNGFTFEIPLKEGAKDVIEPRHGLKHLKTGIGGRECEVWDMMIGPGMGDVARGLFSALRALDLEGVERIFVEGVRDEGEVAAAVMNRLRKAAGEVVYGVE